MARTYAATGDRIVSSSGVAVRYPMTVGSFLTITSGGLTQMVFCALSGSFQASDPVGESSALTVGTPYYVAVVLTASNIRYLVLPLGGAPTYTDHAHSNTFTDGWNLYVTTTNGFIWQWRTLPTQVVLGNWPSDLGWNVRGAMARAQIWDAALTDNELVAAARGSLVRPEKLLRWWELMGVSSPEPDWSATSGNGTVSGAVRGDHPPGIGFPMMMSRRVQRVTVAAVTSLLFRHNPMAHMLVR